MLLEEAQSNLRGEPVFQSAASYYASLFEKSGERLPQHEWAGHTHLDAEREDMDMRARCAPKGLVDLQSWVQSAISWTSPLTRASAMAGSKLQDCQIFFPFFHASAGPALAIQWTLFCRKRRKTGDASAPSASCLAPSGKPSGGIGYEVSLLTPHFKLPIEGTIQWPVECRTSHMRLTPPR